MNYYIKEINSCESRILDKIDIIKRYGSSVSQYEEKLQEIINKIDDNSISLPYGSAALVLQKESINREVLTELNKLEEELNSYEFYLKIYFKINSLNKELDNIKNITDEKIKIYTKEAKSLIEEIDNINIDNIKDSKKIIQDIYYTVYKIIKIELIMNGKSDVLNCIVIGNKGIEYINDLVREEINKLQKEDIIDEEILACIDELSEEGINYTYADSKLILLLALKDNDLVLTKFNNQYILYEEKIKKLKENKHTTKNNQSIVQHRLNEHEIKRNKSRNKAIIGSIFLALNLVSYKYMPSITKSVNTTTTYKANREAYDTITDEVRKEEGEYGKKNETEYTELIKYGKVDKYGKRTVIKYTLKDNSVEDIREYINLIDDKTSYTNKNTINYRFSEQLSKDEYTVIERMTYDDELVIFNEEEYNKDLQRALMIIYTLGGIFTTSMLTYLLIAHNYNKKYIDELTEFGNNDKLVDNAEYKIKYYEELKKELLELKDDYTIDGLSLDEYKKVLRK